MKKINLPKKRLVIDASTMSQNEIDLFNLNPIGESIPNEWWRFIARQPKAPALAVPLFLEIYHLSKPHAVKDDCGNLALISPFEDGGVPLSINTLSKIFNKKWGDIKRGLKFLESLELIKVHKKYQENCGEITIININCGQLVKITPK